MATETETFSSYSVGAGIPKSSNVPTGSVAAANQSTTTTTTAGAGPSTFSFAGLSSGASPSFPQSFADTNSPSNPPRDSRTGTNLAWDPSIINATWLAGSPHAQKPGHRSQSEAQSDSFASGRSMEETCKRSLDHFPQASVAFPAPTLEFDFRVAVSIKPTSSHINCRPASVPAACPVPTAADSPGSTSSSASASAPTSGAPQKEIATIASGNWSGSFGNGRVVAGGYDLGQARGFRPIRIVEGAFVLQTNDEVPATLEMRTRGSLSGPCDVLDSLLALQQPKHVDPRRYGFRMFSTIKTTDKRYAEVVNCGLWIASGVWRGEELIIDAYRVA